MSSNRPKWNTIVNREMSSTGMGSRGFGGGDYPGSVTKILVGNGAGSLVLSVITQPGKDHPIEIGVQRAGFRRAPHAYETGALNHRPVGDIKPVSAEVASMLIDFANSTGSLPAGKKAVDFMQNISGIGGN